MIEDATASDIGETRGLGFRVVFRPDCFTDEVLRTYTLVHVRRRMREYAYETMKLMINVQLNDVVALVAGIGLGSVREKCGLSFWYRRNTG